MFLQADLNFPTNFFWSAGARDVRDRSLLTFQPSDRAKSRKELSVHMELASASSSQSMELSNSLWLGKK